MPASAGFSLKRGGNPGIPRHPTASQCQLSLAAELSHADGYPGLLDEHDQRAVILGLRKGDRDAWTALYDRYGADVWRYVARLLGADPAATADVVQEVFLAAAKSAARFDPERGSLWGWLVGIAHHQVSQHWRGTARAARVTELAAAGVAELRHWWESGEPVSEFWERRELAELVRGALADLPADYAALLTGKYWEEQTLEQLAAQWNSTTEAVKSKLARARREFRAVFEGKSASCVKDKG